MAIKKPKSLTQTQAALLSGVTQRGLQVIMESTGQPPRDDAGQLPVEPFAAWLKNRHLKDLGVTDDGVVYDYNKERARLTKEQADHEALKVAEKNGSMIDADVVGVALGDACSNLRAKMLAMPNKLAHQIAGLNDLAEVQDILDGSIREALGELNHDALQRIINQGNQGRAKEPIAAAKANGERVGRH